MTDLSGAGGGKLRSAQTAALFLTQLPQVTGESLAGQLRDVASEISAELEKRPRQGLAGHLRKTAG